MKTRDDRAMALEIGRLIDQEQLGPVAESGLVAAEREMGVAFPKSYRIFLRKYGTGYCR